MLTWRGQGEVNGEEAQTCRASFPDSPTRLLSEFGHSTSPFLYVHMQSLCNVRSSFHSLNSRSVAKAEEKVIVVLISCCIVERPILQPFVTVFHSIVKWYCN